MIFFGVLVLSIVWFFGYWLYHFIREQSRQLLKVRWIEVCFGKCLRRIAGKSSLQTKDSQFAGSHTASYGPKTTYADSFSDSFFANLMKRAAGSRKVSLRPAKSEQAESATQNIDQSPIIRETPFNEVAFNEALGQKMFHRTKPKFGTSSPHQENNSSGGDPAASEQKLKNTDVSPKSEHRRSENFQHLRIDLGTYNCDSTPRESEIRNLLTWKLENQSSKFTSERQGSWSGGERIMVEVNSNPHRAGEPAIQEIIEEYLSRSLQDNVENSKENSS